MRQKQVYIPPAPPPPLELDPLAKAMTRIPKDNKRRTNKNQMKNMNCKIITNDISVSVLNIQRCKLSERSMDVESCHERGIMHWNAKADVKYCCFIDTARLSPKSK